MADNYGRGGSDSLLGSDAGDFGGVPGGYSGEPEASAGDEGPIWLPLAGLEPSIISPTPMPVHEQSTWLMMAAGIAALGFLKRRRA